MPRKNASARVLNSRTVFQGKVFHVTSDEVIEPGGAKVRRDTVRHSGSVVVAAVDDQDRVLLARQYRHPAKAFLWELPAGRIDEGESPLAAAKRELIEETGYTAREWRKALFFYSSPGFLDETMTVYVARKLTQGKAQPEADEDISLRRFALPGAVNMVVTGRIRDGKTIAALLWLDRQKFAHGEKSRRAT